MSVYWESICSSWQYMSPFWPKSCGSHWKDMPWHVGLGKLVNLSPPPRETSPVPRLLWRVGWQSMYGWGQPQGFCIHPKGCHGWLPEESPVLSNPLAKSQPCWTLFLSKFKRETSAVECKSYILKLHIAHFSYLSFDERHNLHGS